MSKQQWATWVKPPGDLQKNVIAYGKRVEALLAAIAMDGGQKMQDEARQNAPWTDRTGNARQGLFFLVMKESETLYWVFLAHAMEYGKWLELSNGGKYSIIMKTIQRNLPYFRKRLKDIFGD